MTTAIDTNVLLDLRIPGAAHAESSLEALTASSRAGALVISEAVYAELAAFIPRQADLDHFLADTAIRLQPSGPEVLHRAGRAWRVYADRRPADLSCPQCDNTQTVHCSRCGSRLAPRQHVLADFLIGAHALVHADRLLTRDRGYYASYFPTLVLIP